MHHLTLENLHFVRQLVELYLIPDDAHFFLIKVAPVPRHSHIDPVVLLLDHVVDALDAHQEPEDGVVALQRVPVKQDLKWPVTLNKTEQAQKYTHSDTRVI